MRFKAQKILKVVSKIPKGMVMTYGDVARACGLSCPRYVGFVLHNNPDPAKYPCHRVVNFQGKVAKNYAFGGENIQRQKLEKEGIVFCNNKINLKKYSFLI